MTHEFQIKTQIKTKFKRNWRERDADNGICNSSAHTKNNNDIDAGYVNANCINKIDAIRKEKNENEETN